MEQSEQQSTPLQDSKPWEKNWVAKPIQAVKEAVDVVTDSVEAVKQGRMPWDRGWKLKAPVEAPKGLPDPSSHEFDAVFNRLIQAESRGQHTDAKGRLTTSEAGAKGITQVMPKTGAIPGFGVTPIQDKSEEEYKRFGRDYLQAMVREFNGDYEKAVAAYNAGVGNVKKAVAKGGTDWKDYLPKKSETIPYLNRILGNATKR